VSTLVAEAARTATAQRISSAMVAVLCAAICAVTLLTVGRTASAEEAVLARLDSAGSRLLVVIDERDAGLVSPAVVEVLSGLDTVERVVGVDSPFDVVNGVVGVGGERVPAWPVAGDLAQAVALVGGRWPEPGEALVSATGQERLGMTEPFGVATGTDGAEYPVGGAFTTREPFESFEAGLVVAADPAAVTRSVHVVVASVDAARATQALALALLAPPDLGQVSVQSPTALADLQRAVGGDLGEYGRSILLLTLGGGASLIAAVALAEVLLQRRDLGRRRALGAPRWALIGLVVSRTTIAAAPGAVAGTVAGLAALAPSSGFTPADFTAAVALLTVLAAAVASVLPAVLAATRDPVSVLRMP
jgi:putative ABC transport system permease protein